MQDDEDGQIEYVADEDFDESDDDIEVGCTSAMFWVHFGLFVC